MITLTKKDTEVSKDLVKLWVDFASDKKPLKFRNVIFNANSKDNDKLTWLHIKNDNPKMIPTPFIDRLKFWEELNIP